MPEIASVLVDTPGTVTTIAGVIAAGNNVNTITLDPNFASSGFISPSDIDAVFGFANRDTITIENVDFSDDSATPGNIDATHQNGIPGAESNGRGILGATETDLFFAIADTDTPSFDPDITGRPAEAVFSFDISDAISLTDISMGFAAQGNWEASDVITITASIDGGAEFSLYSVLVDDTIDDVVYLMDGTDAGGANFFRDDDDPITIDGTIVTAGLPNQRSFQDFTSNAVSGLSGTTLEIFIRADTNAASEHLLIENIVINGSVSIPTTLSVSFDDAEISENGGSTTGTVTRVGDTASALTVDLSSDDTGEATVPATASFAAGSATATFTVTGVDDAIIDDAQTVTISASSTNPDVTGGANTISVTDDEIISGTPDDDTLEGTSGPDSLTGGDGNDFLDGLGDDDTMAGGPGDDRYFVDTPGDIVTETPGEGYDRIMTSIDLTLADNVEAGNLLGTGDTNLSGNDLDNWLNGNSGNNTLIGGVGNDRLDGNAGNDTLIGNTGNDVLEGGTGADVFVFAPGDGIDLILDFEVGVDLIDITATGRTFTDLVVTGDAAETVIVYDSVDASEAFSLTLEGVDFSTLSAASFIEPAVPTPPPDVVGDGGDNFLRGSGASETLLGLDGNDRLRGGLGDDELNGGDGDDTHEINSVGDAIVEGSGANSGYDRALIYSDTISGGVVTLGANVEAATILGTSMLTLQGNASDNWFIGNAEMNVLFGFGGNDRLDGRGGDDQLIGGAGTDLLSGGIGLDQFLFESDDGQDVILDYSVADDELVFVGVDQASVSAEQSGADVLIRYDGDDAIRILNQSIADFDLAGSEFQFL